MGHLWGAGWAKPEPFIFDIGISNIIKCSTWHIGGVELLVKFGSCWAAITVEEHWPAPVTLTPGMFGFVNGYACRGVNYPYWIFLHIFTAVLLGFLIKVQLLHWRSQHICNGRELCTVKVSVRVSVVAKWHVWHRGGIRWEFVCSYQQTARCPHLLNDNWL